jgi:hypothetical protein
MAKELQVHPVSGNSLLDLLHRIEPLRIALWQAALPWQCKMQLSVCHAWYNAWKAHMASANAAARWLVTCTPRADREALPGLIQRAAAGGRLDVAAALLAGFCSWDEARCNWQLVDWARKGRSELCHLLLTRWGGGFFNDRSPPAMDGGGWWGMSPPISLK